MLQKIKEHRISDLGGSKSLIAFIVFMACMLTIVLVGPVVEVIQLECVRAMITVGVAYIVYRGVKDGGNGNTPKITKDNS